MLRKLQVSAYEPIPIATHGRIVPESADIEPAESSRLHCVAALARGVHTFDASVTGCFTGGMPSSPHRPPTGTGSLQIGGGRRDTRIRPRSGTSRWGDAVDVLVGDRPVVALLPDGGRVRVGLVMPVVDRVVDISVQPSSAAAALVEAARHLHQPVSAIEPGARRALVEAANRAGSWVPSSQMCLVRSFGGATFPLLAAAYDDGAAPLAEVPRWADAILSAATIRDGAVVAFGTRATRPVRRSLVEAIRALPSGDIDLTALALALIGQDVLEPDQLARVLGAPRVLHPSSDLPDRATLRNARRVVGAWGATRTERILIDAAGGADGMAVLLRTVDYARQLGDHGPAHPLPNRLAELHDVHRALMRSAPAPSQPEPEPSSGAPAPPPARRAPRRQHRMVGPPVGSRALRADTLITHPASVRALDGHCVGDLAFVLPHTVGDLERWSRLLSNCLDDFGAAAVMGRSVLVGVLKSNRLTYAIELTPQGSIRQFCGRANRRPTERDERTVIDAMTALGALAPGRHRAGIDGQPPAHRAS